MGEHGGCLRGRHFRFLFEAPAKHSQEPPNDELKRQFSRNFVVAIKRLQVLLDEIRQYPAHFGERNGTAAPAHHRLVDIYTIGISVLEHRQSERERAALFF